MVIERIGAVFAAQPSLAARDRVLALKGEGLDVKKSKVDPNLCSWRDMFRRKGDPPKWHPGMTVRTHQCSHSSAANEAGSKLVTLKQGPQFDAVTEDLPGAPFFRVDQPGGRKILCSNRSYQFYTLHDSDLEATGQRVRWFHLVRNLWSQRYHRALQQITSDGTIDQSA